MINYLWLLEAREDLEEGTDPWEPWYDTCRSVVVAAGDIPEARYMAQGVAQDEAHPDFMGKPTGKTATPWLQTKYSTCTKIGISVDDDPKVIIQHIHFA